MTDAAVKPGSSGPASSTPHDRDTMLRDVLRGLTASPKTLSPKYFYDARGSELFEEITGLDEYYLTRTERGLLERWVPEWVDALGPAALVELGAGSAAKSRVILDAMADQRCGELYIPVDVSGDFLQETAARLREEYDGLRVAPAVADMSAPLDLPEEPPEPTWFALLGSTIGNFDPGQAVRLLGRVARRLRPSDRFLMGVDRRPGPHKSRERLEAAYNDARGVTAAFNRNILHVLNRELSADFQPDRFRHRAFYDPDEGRIEMHLVAEAAQTVRFRGGAVVRFEEGESVRTEISNKFDRASVDVLFREAGLVVDRWEDDGDQLFALLLGRAAA